MSVHVWVRAEEKPAEHRMAMTPAVARHLLQRGIRVTIENSSQGCIETAEFEAVGCAIASAGTWVDTPADTIILGLKELAEDEFPLVHRHIHFAHVYKHQQGWQRHLERYRVGGGALYDLEYLVDEKQRRVAAFGYWAGYAGAALALVALAGQQRQQIPPLPPIHRDFDQQALQEYVVQSLAAGNSALNVAPSNRPTVLVIGALGRSGAGAVELARSAGCEVLPWDLEQTRRGGPFSELLDVDIVLNCVFVQQAIAPFLTLDMLARSDRRLGVVCDVSCDPYSDYNPLPLYQRVTSFADPVHRLVEGDNPLDLIAIDHLPSLLPVESTTDFVGQLQVHLAGLDTMDTGVWGRAAEVFSHKLEESRQSTSSSL